MGTILEEKVQLERLYNESDKDFSRRVKKEKYFDSVTRNGPCPANTIVEEFRQTFPCVMGYLRRLRDEGKIIFLKYPKSTVKRYDFFKEVFPKNGYLIFDPNNSDHLEELAKRFIFALPNPIHPWVTEHIDNQLDRMKDVGLPEEVYGNVKFYAHS